MDATEQQILQSQPLGETELQIHLITFKYRNPDLSTQKRCRILSFISLIPLFIMVFPVAQSRITNKYTTYTCFICLFHKINTL